MNVRFFHDGDGDSGRDLRALFSGSEVAPDEFEEIAEVFACQTSSSGGVARAIA